MAPKLAEDRKDSDSSSESSSADSFGIGDTVAVTADFCIGGRLAVERGCRGTVKSHGERPDGSKGVAIKFAARKDGSDAHVLCQPHEIQVVAPTAHAQQMRKYATLLEHQLRRACKSVRASAVSLREILSSSPVIEDTQSKKDRKKKDKKKNDDYDLEDMPSDTPQTHQRWSVLIVALVLANFLLGYVHIQRRAGKQNLHVVSLLTDASFSKHIVSHPNGTLVNFFSSQCEPCGKLAPQFEEAAKQLQKTTDVSLVSVDSARVPSALKQYLVKQLPTLLWFRRGRLVRNVDPSVRSTAQILEFVHEALQPAVIEFASYAEFLEAVPQLRTVLSKGKTPPIVAGFGPNPAVHEVLEQVGEKFRGETAFLFVPEARDNDPSIRAYFRDVEADKDYQGSLSTDEFMSWLQPFMVE